MIGYSYRYSRLIITVQTVFHLFVLITRQSLPSSPIEIPGQTFYVLLAISNMSRISPLSNFIKRVWWNIRSRWNSFVDSFSSRIRFFFFPPRKTYRFIIGIRVHDERLFVNSFERARINLYFFSYPFAWKKNIIGTIYHIIEGGEKKR